jgi:glucose-6-phosphate 1-epimerase
VVWNPGAERAQAMGDLGPEGHLQMLCIESANAPIADDAVTLSPGAQHVMSVQYRVVPMPSVPL